MTGNRRHSRTDWKRADSHVITDEEYREAPEWTEDDFARAEFAVGEVIIQPGQPPIPWPAGVRPVALPIPPDVIEHFQSTSVDWRGRINQVLAEQVAREKAQAE